MEQLPPLPRAIDPNLFAAIREPEITALCEAVKSLLGDRYGQAGLSRHLRRRTRSHNPYSHRRRPNAKLEALRRHGQPGDAPSDKDSQPGDEPTSYSNRAMRRRPQQLHFQHLESSRWTEASVAQKGGLRRLETHLWHAKRLSLVSRWGWLLPEGEPGRGRGSRAFARGVVDGSVMHDASYWCPFELAGAPAALHAVLKQVLDPRDAADIIDSCSECSGWERQSIIHHAQRFPHAAIGPAHVMQLPVEALANAGSDIHLCIWVHAAAVAEAHAALSAAIAEGALLRILDLRRLEMRGSKANSTLAGILALHPQSAGLDASVLPSALKSLEAGEVRHMVLPDPRLIKPVVLGTEAATLLEGLECGVSASLLQQDLPPPLSVAAVSKRRQALRRRTLYLDTPRTGNGGSDEMEQQQQDAQPQSEAGSTHFPTLFVRQQNGWSVILPPGWVLPIWLSLAFTGCRPVGQREWRWLHTLQATPFFPDDTPDTQAYSTLMAQLSIERKQKAERQPKGKRATLSLPPCPPWQALAGAEHLVPSAPPVLNSHGDMEVVDRQQPGGEKAIFLARSQAMVATALWGLTNAETTLLQAQSNSPVFHALAAGTLHWQPREPPSSGSELCLVETLVHVVKQGLATEGSKLCVIRGQEADRTTQPRHLKSVSSPDGTHAAAEQRTSFVDPGDLRAIGYVCSAAPHGSPRTAASMAVCSASAVWRLRALQHYAPRRDRGTVQAWLCSPAGTTLFPVRLSLLVERP